MGPIQTQGPPVSEDEDLGFELDWITYGNDKTSLAELMFTRDEFKGLVDNEGALKMVSEQSFKEGDRDDDSTISKEELKTALKGMVKQMDMAIKVDDKFLDKVYKEIDKNGDDEISKEEYISFCIAALKHMSQVLNIRTYERQVEQEKKDMDAISQGKDLEGHATWVKLPEDLETLEGIRDDMNILIKDRDEFDRVAEEHYLEGDEDEDKKINVKELKDILDTLTNDVSQGNQKIPEAEAKKYFKQLDYNNDQQLDKNEFFDLYKFVMKEIHYEILWALSLIHI